MGRNNTPAAPRFTIDLHSGVPVYRQLIDQVRSGIASGSLTAGDELPTVRQLAVDLAINPNPVVRAYRELEIRGVLATQQGTGTFITDKQPEKNHLERQRRVTQLVGELLAKAGAEGIPMQELVDYFNELQNEQNRRT